MTLSFLHSFLEQWPGPGILFPAEKEVGQALRLLGIIGKDGPLGRRKRAEEVLSGRIGMGKVPAVCFFSPPPPFPPQACSVPRIAPRTDYLSSELAEAGKPEGQQAPRSRGPRGGAFGGARRKLSSNAAMLS